MSKPKEQSITWARITNYDGWEEKISTLNEKSHCEEEDRISHEVIENRCQIRIGRSATGSNGIMAELRGGLAGHLAGAPTYIWRQDFTGIIGNIMLVHSDFPHEKELHYKLSAILT